MQQKIKIIYGFTLIEIMVAVAILSIVAAIALPTYNGYIENGRKTECFNEVSAIMLAQSQFFLENNSYFPPNGGGTVTGPTSLEGASGGYFKSTYATAADIAAAQCSYTLVTNAAGNQYTITATGQNKLAGKGTIVTKTVN